MAYSQKHYETEAIETIKFLSKEHPEIMNDLGKTKINLSQYMPQEGLTFSQATNLYDIPSDDTVIMRYMDYDKFKYLIEKEKLYMSSPKGFSQDKNEGYLIPDVGRYIDSILEKTYNQIVTDIQTKRITVSGVNFTGIKSVDRNIMRDRCAKIYRHNLKRFYISCWTERDVDQDNMWNAYIPDPLKRKKAVAIKTTVAKLKKALHKNLGLFAITRVKYVDLDTHKIENVDFLAGGMYSLACYMLKLKSKNYEDDREIRLISDNLMTNRTQWYKAGVMSLLGIEKFDYNAEAEYNATSASLDLNDFIDEIIVSPTSEDCFIDEVKGVLVDNNVNEISIKKSKINMKRSFYWDN